MKTEKEKLQSEVDRLNAEIKITDNEIKKLRTRYYESKDAVQRLNWQNTIDAYSESNALRRMMIELHEKQIDLHKVLETTV